uniref:Uncharacterized protein n=1 Tax=Oryza meridionalis TaxID=40149 RepID=A0A0E0EM41_9ORYZ
MATFSSAILEAEQSETRAKEVGRWRSGVSGGGRARRGGRGGSLQQQSDGGGFHISGIMVEGHELDSDSVHFSGSQIELIPMANVQPIYDDLELDYGLLLAHDIWAGTGICTYRNSGILHGIGEL